MDERSLLRGQEIPNGKPGYLQRSTRRWGGGPPQCTRRPPWGGTRARGPWGPSGVRSMRWIGGLGMGGIGCGVGSDTGVLSPPPFPPTLPPRRLRLSEGAWGDLPPGDVEEPEPLPKQPEKMEKVGALPGCTLWGIGCGSSGGSVGVQGKQRPRGGGSHLSAVSVDPLRRWGKDHTQGVETARSVRIPNPPHPGARKVRSRVWTQAGGWHKMIETGHPEEGEMCPWVPSAGRGHTRGRACGRRG